MIKELVEKYNTIISETLGVQKLEMTVKIAEKAKSEYGHWSYNPKKGGHILQISEFVVGTPLQENIIQHELCHAYVYEYISKTEDHGPNFKKLTDGIFNHDKVKKPWVNDIESCYINDKENFYELGYRDEIKAIFKINPPLVEVFDINGLKFKHENTSTIYKAIFKRIMQLQ